MVLIDRCPLLVSTRLSRTLNASLAFAAAGSLAHAAVVGARLDGFAFGDIVLQLAHALNADVVFQL
jgi:hypothetical protein